MRLGDALVTPRSDATYRPKRRPARVDDSKPALGRSLPGVAPDLHVIRIISPLAGALMLRRHSRTKIRPPDCESSPVRLSAVARDARHSFAKDFPS
jgi:hypothetical protein